MLGSVVWLFWVGVSPRAFCDRVSDVGLGAP